MFEWEVVRGLCWHAVEILRNGKQLCGFRLAMRARIWYANQVPAPGAGLEAR